MVTKWVMMIWLGYREKGMSEKGEGERVNDKGEEVFGKRSRRK